MNALSSMCVVSLALLSGCAGRPRTTAASAAPPATCESGEATYYADSLAGRSTASGEPYDPRELTAAHRRAPFGSRVRVVLGDREVVVRINDRGPFSRGGVIDLSRAAGEQLGMVRAGRVRVHVCPS